MAFSNHSWNFLLCFLVQQQGKLCLCVRQYLCGFLLGTYFSHFQLNQHFIMLKSFKCFGPLVCKRISLWYFTSFSHIFILYSTCAFRTLICATVQWKFSALFYYSVILLRYCYSLQYSTGKYIYCALDLFIQVLQILKLVIYGRNRGGCT